MLVLRNQLLSGVFRVTLANPFMQTFAIEGQFPANKFRLSPHAGCAKFLNFLGCSIDFFYPAGFISDPTLVLFCHSDAG